MSIVIMYSCVPNTLLIEHMIETVQTAEPFAGNCWLTNFFFLTHSFLTVNPECLKQNTSCHGLLTD